MLKSEYEIYDMLSWDVVTHLQKKKKLSVLDYSWVKSYTVLHLIYVPYAWNVNYVTHRNYSVLGILTYINLTHS